MVAEAQLSNVTRTKLKEAFEQHFKAHMLRAEKQAIIASKGQELLQYLDDSSTIPGDTRPEYTVEVDARNVLYSLENELVKLTLDDKQGLEEREDARLASRNYEPEMYQNARETSQEEYEITATLS